MSPAERIARSRLARLDEGLSTWQATDRPEVAWAALDAAREALTAWRRSIDLSAPGAEGERWQAGEAAWLRAEARLLGLDVAEPVRVSLEGGVVLAGGAEGVRERVEAGLRGAGKIARRRAA